MENHETIDRADPTGADWLPHHRGVFKQHRAATGPGRPDADRERLSAGNTTVRFRLMDGVIGSETLVYESPPIPVQVEDKA